MLIPDFSDYFGHYQSLGKKSLLFVKKKKFKRIFNGEKVQNVHFLKRRGGGVAKWTAGPLSYNCCCC